MNDILNYSLNYKTRLQKVENYILEIAYLLEIDNSIIENKDINYDEFCKLIIEKAEYVKFQSDEFDSEKAPPREVK